jgi:hypothetical protein
MSIWRCPNDVPVECIIAASRFVRMLPLGISIVVSKIPDELTISVCLPGEKAKKMKQGNHRDSNESFLPMYDSRGFDARFRKARCSAIVQTRTCSRLITRML